MFTEMKAQGVTYDELEFLSGVLRCTTKSWRFERNPNLETIQATLGALGWQLVPVPDVDLLLPETRAALADFADLFATDDEALASAIAAAAGMPEYNRRVMNDMANRRAA